MATDDDDEDLLPKKKPTVKTAKASSGSGGGGPSPQMRRLMRIGRGVGVLLGGFVTAVTLMSVVGLVTDNFLARAIVALVFVVGIPAVAADRMLKRSKGGGLGLVADVFAIVLLGIALLVESADAITRPLLASEADRYAKSGSTAMARTVYFLAGVDPIFPGEKPPPK